MPEDTTPDDGIELTEIVDPTSHADLVRATFDAVLRPSFEHDELPSLEWLTQADAGHELLILVASDDEGPAAAAVYGRPVGGALGVLSYLATRPGERGRGLGGRLLRRLTEFVDRTDVAVVLGEVHDPRFYEETADEQATARLRFYERHGAVALTVPWVQPRLSPGAERVRDMLLIALHTTPELAADGIPSRWLTEWATAYFADEEGAVPDDGEFRALLARWSHLETVPTIPLDQIDTIPRLEVVE